MSHCVYWLHLSDEQDMFTQGYIGVTSNIKKRMRSHKHRFKHIWNNIILETILIGSKDYCYSIEKKLRPIRHIGWNCANGGFKNNVMTGTENPNFGHFGEYAPNFQGYWITPKGKFATSKEAAIANNLQQSTIIRKCKGRKVNNKFYPSKQGWAFEPKVRVAS